MTTVSPKRITSVADTTDTTGANTGANAARANARAVTRLLRSMRAVGRFSDRPVPYDVLIDILNTARWTGSSKNTQPWEVVVVRERATLEALSQLGQFAGHLAGAQAALILVMDSASNAFDCGRLAQSAMLSAWAHGVGSCIGSLFPEEYSARAKDLLGIPLEKWVRQTISLGYPDGPEALRVSSTPRTATVLPSLGRKPLDRFASWERYGQRSRSK